jgi:hypothetical protein
MLERDVIPAVDQAIAALKSARKMLAVNGRGTRLAAKSTTKPAPTAKSAGGKRVLSEEARQRIVDAQRRRWAAVRKAAKKAARQTA